VFFADFSAHHALFTRGTCPWSGHRCQKHPSMKTATLHLVNAMSIVRCGTPGTDRHPIAISVASGGSQVQVLSARQHKSRSEGRDA
jgi:hypothetical protein